MFETAVVRARAADRHFGFLSFSLAIHTAAISAIIAASVSSTRFPDQAPKQMFSVILAPAVTLPPALGTSAAAPKSKTAAAPIVKAPVAPAAPTTIPDTLASQPSASDIGRQPGSESDVGVEWGEKDGVGVDAPPGIAPDAAGPLPVGGAVKAPVVIRRVEPPYPRLALQARMSGSVVLQCIIDKTGHIRDVRVLSSSFGGFTQPAIDAVEQWLFAPGTLNGQPVDTIFELTVRFQVK